MVKCLKHCPAWLLTSLKARHVCPIPQQGLRKCSLIIVSLMKRRNRLTSDPANHAHPRYTGTELSMATCGARGQLTTLPCWSVAAQLLGPFPWPQSLEAPSSSCGQHGSWGPWASERTALPFSCDQGKPQLGSCFTWPPCRN